VAFVADMSFGQFFVEKYLVDTDTIIADSGKNRKMALTRERARPGAKKRCRISPAPFFHLVVSRRLAGNYQDTITELLKESSMNFLVSCE
jgi:hypothetical protein